VLLRPRRVLNPEAACTLSSIPRFIPGCIVINIAIAAVLSIPNSWAAKRSFQFEPSEVSVTEGDSVSLTVIRDSSHATETLYYQTQNGSATHGEDYQRIRETRLEFLEGEISKTITVDTLQDTEAEADEQLMVVILGVSGIGVGKRMCHQGR
jgi:hypothetical protein